MRGSIRTLVGLFIVFGAAGGLDNATDADLFLCAAVAAAGLMLMASGVRAMNNPTL